MTLFTRIAATALAGLAILGSASPALAKPQQQPWNLQESRDLLNTVRSTGHFVGIDVARCKEEPAPYGYATSRGVLVICVTRHGDNLNELADTIRHETLHLAQFCHGKDNGASIGLLLPERREEFALRARNELGFTGQGYKPFQVAIENEVRVLAHVLDEHHVTSVLERYCG
jgi:hypothetical protein